MAGELENFAAYMAHLAQNNNPYVHPPLRNGEFRLITLLGSNRFGELEFDIRHVPMDASPTFMAISYAWNDETPSIRAMCHGRPLLITKTVDTMLLSLGRHGPFWIDAICISQHDLAEKAAQVRVLDRYFAMASWVFLWLGPSTDAIDKLFEDLNDFVGSGQQYVEARFQAGSNSSNHTKSRILRGVSDMLQRRWFKRVWTFQEIILAKGYSFACGKHMVKGPKFMNLVFYLIQGGFLSLSDKREGSLRAGNLAVKIATLREQFRRDEGIDILNLLSEVQERESTERVDRIYGVLGLVDSSIREQIPIDYSSANCRNYGEIYLTMAHLSMSGDRKLRILQLATPENRSTNLPSWCPDFSTQNPYMSFGGINCHEAGFRRPSTVPPLGFQDNSSALYACSSDRKRIYMKGFLIGKIDALSFTIEEIGISTYCDLPGERRKLETAFRWLVHCCVFGAFHKDKERLTRCLTASSLYGARTLGRELNDEIPWEWLQNRVDQWLQGLLSNLINATPGFALSRAEQDELAQYTSAATTMSHHRRLLRIGDKVTGYLGLGPESARPGDLLCLFPNTNVPFVLRAHPTETDIYELVGEAYIHGIMNGELLDIFTAEEERIFRIA